MGMDGLKLNGNSTPEFWRTPNTLTPNTTSPNTTFDFKKLFGGQSSSNPMDNKWAGTFGQYAQAGQLGLGAIDTFSRWEAGETAKKNLELQKQQMAKNWAATQANAQLGWENKKAQQLANTGVSGAAARTEAEVGSRDALKRYGLA